MHPNLPKGYSCGLAQLMVNVATSTMVPACAFNPCSYSVVIRQDSVVGQVEPVEEVSTLLQYENPNKRDNLSAARRVLLDGGLHYEIRLVG